MFTRQLIEEIKNKLYLLGKKDSLFDLVKDVGNDAYFSIVVDGENKRVSVQKFIDIVAEAISESKVGISLEFGDSLLEGISLKTLTEALNAIYVVDEDSIVASSVYRTVILPPNMDEHNSCKLTLDMLLTTNTKYVIKYNYDVLENITMPANCILSVDGGKLFSSSGMKTITGVRNTFPDNGDYTLFETILPDEVCVDLDSITLVNFSHASEGGNIDPERIPAQSIDNTKLEDGAVTENKIANGAVTSDKLATNAVTESKIASGAIVEGKIAAGAVAESKIQDSAVTSRKISNSAVTTEKIAQGAVTSNILADESVATSKLADGAVTIEKLDSSVTEALFNKEYDSSNFSGLGKVFLEKNIVNVGGTDKNILSQDAFNKDGEGDTRVPNTNTVFVVPFDFEIGTKRTISVTISSSRVSNLQSPEYTANTEARTATEARKAALEEDRQELIDGGATEEEIAAIDAKIAIVDSRLHTPQYYYYATVTVPAHKVLIAECPGCMFLNSDLTTVLSENTFFGSTTDDESTTAYIAYIHEGTYNFTEDSFISIPDNCVLEFDGGSISSGTIKGNHTSIVASPDAEIFKDNVIIKGLWDITEIYDGWFKYTYTANTANNQIIHNILGLTHDDFSSTVHIVRDTTYLVELPTIPIILKGGVNTSCRKYREAQSYGSAEKAIFGDPWECFDRLEAIRVFSLNSNTRYIIDSIIKMLPTGDDYYQLFGIYHKENIAIEGMGSLIGDNNGADNDHNYYQYYTVANTYFGEQGFIIRAVAVKNLSVKDITLNGSFGDNLYVTGDNRDRYTGLYYEATDTQHIIPSDEITISNLRVLYARRNGIALSCSNAVVECCSFEGNGLASIKGTAPKSGIDFECDQVSLSGNGKGGAILCNRNVVMTDCIFRNNEYDMSSAGNRPWGENTVETYIKSCTFTSPLRLNRTQGMQFEDCFFPLLAGKAESIWSLAASENLNFMRCIFEDSNIRMHSYTSADGQYTIGDNVKFIDCIYYNDFKVEDHVYVYAKSNQMPFLRCKVPPTNSDYYVKLLITFVGNINEYNDQDEVIDTSVGISVMEYAFRVTSAAATMLTCKLLSSRGHAFSRALDDDLSRPRIYAPVIDGYRYFFISNRRFVNYGIGIDYSFNCCKLTGSTSETEFAKFEVEPFAGVIEETEELNKQSVTFLQAANNIYPGNYIGSDGSLRASALSPFFYNGRILFPNGTDVRDNDGELYTIRHKGTTTQRPTPTNAGFKYIDTSIHMPLWWDGEEYMYGDGVRVTAKRCGITADRPTGRHTEYANPEDPTDISPTQDSTHTEEVKVGDLGAVSQQGFVYFDTTLGKPVYAKEINSTTGVITWVDATGTTA